MNAVVRAARDVSPVLERHEIIERGGQVISATVKYRVAYPSIWHRGRGLDPDVEVLAITHHVGTDIEDVPMFPGLLDAIVERIEIDELGVD